MIGSPMIHEGRERQLESDNLRTNAGGGRSGIVMVPLPSARHLVTGTLAPPAITKCLHLVIDDHNSTQIIQSA